MTTSRMSREEIDRLVELHIDLSIRLYDSINGPRPQYSRDPLLPRVVVPTAVADPEQLLLELSRLVLQVYDLRGIPPDLGLLSLRAAVGEAVAAAIEDEVGRLPLGG